MTATLTLEEKKRIYRAFDALIDVKENVPFATVGHLLRRGGITPQRYGYDKLKPFLRALGTDCEGGFLTLSERAVNGGPQSFATFHRRPDWDAEPAQDNGCANGEAGGLADRSGGCAASSRAASGIGTSADIAIASGGAAGEAGADADIAGGRTATEAGADTGDCAASGGAAAKTGRASAPAAQPERASAEEILAAARQALAATRPPAPGSSADPDPLVAGGVGSLADPEPAAGPDTTAPARATATRGTAAAAPPTPTAGATAKHASAASVASAAPVASAAADPLAAEAERIARAMALEPAYRDSPAPPELLASTAPVLTDFCFVPHQRQEQVRAAAPGRAPLDVLRAGWAASRAAGAVRVYEGKLVFPLPALRADGKTPLEASLKRQKHADADLLPWFVSYVNDYVRPAAADAAPSKAIERFAWLGSWDAFLEKLADIALPEQWDFDPEGDPAPRKGAPTSGNRQPDTSDVSDSTAQRDQAPACAARPAATEREAAEAPRGRGRRFAILRSYICTTFYRLQKEGKVAIAAGGELAAFNTGLVDDRYDDIFCCFKPSHGRIPWEFAGFATAGARGLGKQLVSLFSPLPERAAYFSCKEDMLFDVDRELITDYEHVILDNMERLPLEFLEGELSASRPARSVLDELERATDHAERQRLFGELSAIVDGDARLFRRLRSGLEDAVDTARRRVRWNYKAAIPSYYPRDNAMSFLLPLCLLRDNEADAALVVQLTPSGNYQGQTILTMRQAYQNARLICRPDSDWLTPARAGRDEREDEPCGPADGEC